MIALLDNIEIAIKDLQTNNESNNEDLDDLLHSALNSCDNVRDHLGDHQSAMIGKFNLIRDSVINLKKVLSSISDPQDHLNSPIPSSKKFVPVLLPIKPKKVQIVWIPLDMIETSGILSGFNQEKYNTIKRENWFKKLQKYILPVMENFPDIDDEYFSNLDIKYGLSYSEGLLKIYQLFFGDHCIVLSNNPGNNKFSIVNGIHRIFIAQELNLKAIPAKIQI